MAEAEQVFLNQPLFVIDDTKHSKGEVRLHALGKTNEERSLHRGFMWHCFLFATLTCFQYLNGNPIQAILCPFLDK